MTTYNQPDWLEKTLWGYAAQTTRDFDLVVADDGSNGETKARVDAMRKATGLEIHHIWHEDRGFRKCKIVNRAIYSTDADYLIFTDGDCIPRRDFVETHLRWARLGRYLSGGYFKLPPEVSKRITAEDIRANTVFDASWLLQAGVQFTPRLIKFHLPAWLADLCCDLTTTQATFNGMNSSAWRQDILRINGFDERMQYGGLDRELGLRLENAGIRPLQIRYHALCLHLHHARAYRQREYIEFNRALRRETGLTGSTRTRYGIKQE